MGSVWIQDQPCSQAWGMRGHFKTRSTKTWPSGFLFTFIGVWTIYNVALVLGVPCSDSVFSLTLLHLKLLHDDGCIFLCWILLVICFSRSRLYLVISSPHLVPPCFPLLTGNHSLFSVSLFCYMPSPCFLQVTFKWNCRVFLFLSWRFTQHRTL